MTVTAFVSVFGIACVVAGYALGLRDGRRSWYGVNRRRWWQ